MQDVEDKNKDLNADKEKLLKENEDLKRQLEELRRGQQPATQSNVFPLQEQSPIKDATFEDLPPSREQAGTSTAPPSIATRRTYTPIQDYQWLVTKDYFSDLEERARKMYMYKREMYELSRLIPQEHFPKDILEMDKASLRAKIGKGLGRFRVPTP